MIILQYYNSISLMNSQKILKFQKSEDIIGTDSQPHWSFYIHQLNKTTSMEQPRYFSTIFDFNIGIVVSRKNT